MYEINFTVRQPDRVDLLGYLPFSRENRKFRLEYQMVRHSVWKASRKKSDAIFLPFLGSSADLDILYSVWFSHHVNFYSCMFMHKIPPGWFV